MVIHKVITIFRTKGFLRLLWAIYHHFDRKLFPSGRRLRRLCNIRNGTGLEIGPLSTPIVKRSEGRIYYADYFEAEYVAQTYKHIRSDAILKVDFILSETSYAHILEMRGPFDYVIASHVFEHLPNPLGWLREMANILKPGGVISLAIPDCRHSSEYFRKETTLEQILRFEKNDLQRPSLDQLLDCNSNLHSIDTIDTWVFAKQEIKREKMVVDLDKIVEREAAGLYVDAHCTTWTSTSFGTVISDGMKLLNIPLEIVRIDSPRFLSAEFLVQFRRS